MEKEKITLEQIVASALVNYKTKLNFAELNDIFKEFNYVCDIYKDYYTVDKYFDHLKKYINYNNFGIELKEEYPLATAISKDYNLREALLFLAGDFVNNFMEYYTKKGCLNCVNDECHIPDNEKLGITENGLPDGNNCIMWKNNSFRYKTLYKEKK